MRKKGPVKVSKCEYCGRGNTQGKGVFVRYICWACKDYADWIAYKHLNEFREFLKGGWMSLNELMS